MKLESMYAYSMYDIFLGKVKTLGIFGSRKSKKDKAINNSSYTPMVTRKEEDFPKNPESYNEQPEVVEEEIIIVEDIPQNISTSGNSQEEHNSDVEDYTNNYSDSDIEHNEEQEEENIFTEGYVEDAHERLSNDDNNIDFEEENKDEIPSEKLEDSIKESDGDDSAKAHGEEIESLKEKDKLSDNEEENDESSPSEEENKSLKKINFVTNSEIESFIAENDSDSIIVNLAEFNNANKEAKEYISRSGSYQNLNLVVNDEGDEVDIIKTLSLPENSEYDSRIIFVTGAYEASIGIDYETSPKIAKKKILASFNSFIQDLNNVEAYIVVVTDGYDSEEYMQRSELLSDMNEIIESKEK